MRAPAKIHQKVVMMLEMPIRILVGKGREPPRSAYIPSKIGTTNRSMPETIMMIRPSTTTG
jgi:hypothetical protein